MNSKEIPSNSTSFSEEPFVKQILESKARKESQDKDNYYYQLGLLSATGILDKISQWQKYQDDARIFVSDELDGRFALNLRWNFRELEGKQVCDETGLAYIGEAETPLGEYETNEIVRNQDILYYKTKYHEKADFILVWGATPQLVRYFSHGELRKVLQNLYEYRRSISEEDKFFINVVAYSKAFEYTNRFIDEELLDYTGAMGVHDTKNILQNFEDSRVESGRNLSRALISAIQDPRVRINQRDRVLSPFPNDNGFNSIQLFNRLESRVLGTEAQNKRKNEIRESRMLRAADQHVAKNGNLKDDFMQQQESDYALMEEEAAEAAYIEEQEYWVQDHTDHSECHYDEESGLSYAFEETEGNSHSDG